MALREPILAEALDLLEELLAELLFDAALAKTGEQPLVMFLERAGLAPRSHVTTEAVRLAAAVARADDRDLHHLLLEERNAQRALEDRLQNGMRRVVLLVAAATPQVRMHHAALDRAGSHDGHFDHEVVELLRAKARQHRHLRAALDLEDAHGISTTERLVDLGVLSWDAREPLDGGAAGEAALVARGVRRIDARLVANEVEALADRGEHAETEHVDLEKAERVDVVLVPRDDGALVHRGGLDGRDLRDVRGGEHEAADVDREMSRKALDGARERDGPSHARIGRREADGLQARFADRRHAVPPRDDAGEALHLLEREAEDLSHLTERALGAIADDLADHGRAMAPVRLVDLLDHLFAALVLEVDVDVGGLAALRGEEALEEHVGARGIDRGDAEAVADRAVRGTTAALAEDVATPRHVDDGAHGQEVRCDLELRDERELLVELRPHLRGNVVIRAGRVAVAGAELGEPPERLVGGLPRPAVGVAEVAIDEVGDLVGEAIRELLDREPAMIGDGSCPRHPVGMEREEAQDLLFALQMGLGVRQQLAAGLVEGLALADAVEDVEDRLVRRLREKHAIRRAEWHGMGAGGVERAGDARAVLAVLVEVHADGEARSERATELGDGQRRVRERPEAVGARAHRRERDAGERVAR